MSELELNPPDRFEPTTIRSMLDGTLPAGYRALADTLAQFGETPEQIGEQLALLPTELQHRVQRILGRLAHDSASITTDLETFAEALGASQRARNSYRAQPGPAHLESKFSFQPFSIELEEVLVITKISRKSFDQNKLELSGEQLREYYLSRRDDPDRIFASDARQREAEQLLQRYIPRENCLSWELGRAALQEEITRHRFVIALGGDDHFKAVSQLVGGQTVIFGVNSDAVESRGALLAATAQQLVDSLSVLRAGSYRLEAWTRLLVEVNGTARGRAVSEIMIGEESRKIMSHNILTLRGRTVRHDSSALLLATGAGSGGWLNNAARAYFPDGHSFPPTSRYARFVNTESARAAADELGEGVLLEGERLSVRSRNGRSGIISLDSITDILFPRGSEAVVQIDPEPLWIVKL